MATLNYEPSSLRLAAVRRMLRPIVRFALGGVHSIQEFLDVVKLVFVEVAVEEIAKAGLKVNVSRLTMMTGLHRIEVNRFFKPDAAVDKQHINQLVHIIALWQTDPRFTTKAGKPRVLTYEGDDCEFRTLLGAISKCIVPGTALFELERVGAIEKTTRGIKLTRTQFIAQDDPEIFELTARGLEAFLDAAMENIALKSSTGKTSVQPNLLLVTEYDNIFVKELPGLRRWFYKQGARLHKDARALLSTNDKDLSTNRLDEPAGARVMLGTFSFTIPPATVPSTDSEDLE